MGFGDDNAAAAGNAVAAGRNFWGNLMQWRQQQAQLPGVQAQSQKAQTEADVAKATAPDTIQQQKEATAQAGQKTASGSRQAQLDNANMYLSSVTKPDVSDKFSNTTDDQGNVFPGANVRMPFAEAASKGYVPQGLLSNMGPETQTPKDWVAPLDHTKPFTAQPQAVQQEMINRVIANRPPGSAPITPGQAAHALASREFEENTATLPPITPYTLPGGLSVTKLSGGPEGTKWEAANPGVEPITDSSGARTGFVRAGGEVKPDPAYQSPKEVTGAQDSLSDIENTQQQLQAAQDAFNKHPNITGPGVLTGGSKIGQLSRSVQGNTVGNKDYTAQRQLDKFLSSEVPGLLSEVHMGRITELEYGKLTSALPQMGDPKEVWNNYFKLRNEILQKRHDALSQQLQSSGIPRVNIRAANVTPPSSHRVGDSESFGSTGTEGGGAATPQTVKTAEEAKAALAKGQKFIYKGQLYGK